MNQTDYADTILKWVCLKTPAPHRQEGRFLKEMLSQIYDRVSYSRSAHKRNFPGQ